MAKIGIKDVAALQKKAERLAGATKKAREKAGELAENMVTAVETVGTAGALGYIHGRYGSQTVASVELPLVVAVVGHAAALMGVGRGMESHIAAVANGAGSAYAFEELYSKGVKARGLAGKPALPIEQSTPLFSVEGSDGEAVQGQRLTDEQLAKMAKGEPI